MEVKVVVIGLEKSPQERARLWTDLIESKKSYKMFKFSPDYQEQRISELDGVFYAKTLQKYVNNS